MYSDEKMWIEGKVEKVNITMKFSFYSYCCN